MANGQFNNPFYVHPGGDFSSGLTMLGQGIGKLMQDRKAIEEQERQAEESQAVADAFATKNPDTIAKAMIKYPKYAKNLQMAKQFHSDATKENYMDSIKNAIRIIRSPGEDKEARLQELIENRKKFLDEAGVPVEQRRNTDNFLELYRQDPEKALKTLEYDLAVADPDTALKLSKAFAGPEGEKAPTSARELAIYKRMVENKDPQAEAYGRKVGLVTEPDVPKLKDRFKVVGKVMYDLKDPDNPKPIVSPGNATDSTALISNIKAAGFTPGTPEFEGAMRRALFQVKALAPEQVKKIKAETASIVAKEERAVEKQQIEEDKRQTKVNTQIDQAKRLIGEADTLAQFALDNPKSVGFEAAALSKVPQTSAYNLNRKVGVLKANLGFDKLQAMRDASPTGGALGQVSERELGFLQSTVASLDQNMGQEEFLNALSKVKEHYQKWLDTLEGNIPEGYDEEGNPAEDDVPRSPGTDAEGNPLAGAPQTAIDFLKANPQHKQAFIDKYGYLPEGM